MKKIMFMAAFVVAMAFASCGSKSTSAELGVAADSTEVVADSVAVDTLAVDTVAVDSVVAE